MRPLDPRVVPHLRPALRPLVGVLAGGLCGGLLTVAQAYAVGTLVVRLVQDPGGDAWHPAAWWTVGIVLARAAAAYLVDAASAAAAARVSTTLRHRLVAAALRLDPLELARHRTGALTVLATRGTAAVEPYLTRYLPTLVLAAVLPPATVATILWLDWPSAVIVVLTLPLVPVFAALIGLATRDRADRQWRQLTALSGHFLDVVTGLPTLVAFRRARAQSSSIRSITGRYRRATVETLKIAFASSAVLELIATISVALVAVAVGLRLASGNLDFHTALVVLLLAPEAYWPLRRVGAEFHAAAEGAAAFEQATALLDAAAPATPEAGRPELADLPSGAVAVTALSVRYPGRAAPALEQVTATFPSPGLTAVTGPSGCGKSTLLLALLGELPAEGGGVRVGDRDLADLPTGAWRRQVAWAPQRPWLLDASIADNLRVGRPDADEETLWRALDRVRLSDLVRELPGALGHRLGEDGAGLSAGQRARLSLARVVVAARPYVVLDEPTAHLDAETERVLLDTLRDLARDACVVVVAHRPAVVDAADHVVALPPRTVAAVAEEPTDPATGRARAVAVAGDPPADDDRSRFGLRSGTLLGTLSVASGVALTATASWLITRAADHPPVLTLLVAIVGVRTFGLARPVLRYAERIVSHDAALRLLAERRAEVYDLLVPLVPGRLGARRGDVLASVVDDVDSVVDRQLRVRQPVWTALGVGVLATLFAVLQAPVAGLVTAAVAGLGALGGLVAHRGVAAAEPAFVAARAEVSTRVEATVRSARELVGWQQERRALSDLDAAGADQARAAGRAARAVAAGRTLPLLAGGGGLLAMALTVPGAPISAAMLALLVMVPLALVDAVAPLPDAAALAVRTRAAEERLARLSAAEPAVTDPAAPAPAPSGHPSVSADRVSAGWGDADAFVDVSLALAPGARVGLVGASGTGKSTFAALLLRFLDPHAGAVRLAEVDLRDLALDDVRRLVGLVDDDPHVFGSTVVENVRLARPEATDDEVAAALDAAHLGAWVRQLPDGLHTLVGEGHAAVSGGERARLGVARALLADPPVLVLDEPTAHLDSETAQRVADEILDTRRERSIVWITHGRTGLDRMDDVVRLGGVRGSMERRGEGVGTA